MELIIVQRSEIIAKCQVIVVTSAWRNVSTRLMYACYDCVLVKITDDHLYVHKTG